MLKAGFLVAAPNCKPPKYSLTDKAKEELIEMGCEEVAQ